MRWLDLIALEHVPDPTRRVAVSVNKLLTVPELRVLFQPHRPSDAAERSALLRFLWEHSGYVREYALEDHNADGPCVCGGNDHDAGGECLLQGGHAASVRRQSEAVMPHRSALASRGGRPTSQGGKGWRRSDLTALTRRMVSVLPLISRRRHSLGSSGAKGSLRRISA
jgi:hypothetical protein